jgi:hypothetical protein
MRATFTACFIFFHLPLTIFSEVYKWLLVTQERHAVARLIEALRYEPEGRGVDYR